MMVSNNGNIQILEEVKNLGVGKSIEELRDIESRNPYYLNQSNIHV